MIDDSYWQNLIKMMAKSFLFGAVVFFVFMEQSWLIALEFQGARISQSYYGPVEDFSFGKGATQFSQECPIKCICKVQAARLIVNCNQKQLTSMPQKLHPSTRELHLFKNQLTDISSNSSLYVIEVLNISNNNISNINKEWISAQRNLMFLDASKNNLRTKAIEDIFSNLTLLQLNLSYNKLEEISAMTFQKLSSLKALDLSYNEIKKIDYKSFQNQKSLETLDLSFNKLINLTHEWFKNLHNLKVLAIKNNRLRTLSNVVFSPLGNLESLDISGNFMTSVGLLSFKGLINLQYLNLSHNSIGNLQERIFRPLEKTKVIDLSYNMLHSFDRVFAYTRNLKILFLKHMNNLKSLNSFSFTGLSSLKFLDISGSQSLSRISKSAFLSTKELQNLDISNTNLTNLQMGIFKPLMKVQTIRLAENPWHCDCYLYWLLLWLGEHTNTHLLSPSETTCQTPARLEGKALLDSLDHSIVCTNASISHISGNTKFRVGSTAILQCQITGSPFPVLTWITPQKLTFHWIELQNNNHSNASSENITLFPSNHPKIHTVNLKVPDGGENERFLLMSNGDLLIRNVQRGDGGFYMCIASNPLSNHSVSVRLTLDYDFLSHVKIVSILVGMATSFGFLLLTLVSVLVEMILKRFGIQCPCNIRNTSPKSQQIKKILESIENYKKQQLDRLRDNYNSQVQRIKDNCMQQMERLRESYSSQAERLRDIRDYGTLQIDRIRENYYSQVQRVRDYSTGQIERLRENYLFQRNRIRKFSANHLYKLRENYKLQQQHLNKILENLNIESCRNVCQRTESVIFEPDITLENVFVPKICLVQSFARDMSDSVDNSSQISAYFTPDEATSEVSGHESDEHDGIGVTKSHITPSVSNSYLVLEIKDEVNEISEKSNDCVEENFQIDVIFDNIKSSQPNANETIV